MSRERQDVRPLVSPAEREAMAREGERMVRAALRELYPPGTLVEAETDARFVAWREARRAEREERRRDE